MAERRMISLKVIDTDLFLDMPVSTRYLYHELNARADDDGFINSAKKITKMVGCSDDDLKILIAKEFLIPFQSGIIVIKHWRISNYVPKDRYKTTIYQEEKNQLITDKTGEYFLENNDLSTKCIQNVYEMDTQVRLGKDRLGKDRISKDNIYSVYSQNSELVQALEDFEKMRKSIKKPLTEKAKQMLLAELDRLSNDDNTKIAILNQSIFHNWQGVFPLKTEKGATSNLNYEIIPDKEGNIF
mgnify:CR=1 FL=1